MIRFGSITLLLCANCDHQVNDHTDGGCSKIACHCSIARETLVDYSIEYFREDQEREWGRLYGPRRKPTEEVA